MILPFYHTYPATGKPTFFKDRIRGGWKKHTFRTSMNWKPGEPIEFAEDLPDGRRIPFDLPGFKLADNWHTKEMEDGRKIHLPLCCAIEPFQMEFLPLVEEVGETSAEENFRLRFLIGDLFILDEDLLEVIANTDGFENRFEFMNFFNDYRIEKKTDVILGQIVHWTRNVYAVDAAQIL